ncbi:cell division protein FtsZ [Paraflavitalea soli]|uniref:Cell division protein FtsZ n=1 Tax=Paraflavitalea soli TaxID=2315862 RepID=A0A3B7MXE0_9BACT|nr:cell division protein FtsZ [Paraflavitalea soli]AXY77696.1 cell division protein FtsZ [Paraflavitalea soli]
MIHFDLPKEKSSIIKVIGVGGGGSNAVNHMFSQQIDGVNFIICNTDAQAIATSKVPNKVQLGPHLTQGLGAGANPDIGRQATEESLEEIRRILEVNTKMAFITAGMGGGTGTGGAPIISKICKDLGILTVGIVTTPFSYEGKKRQLQAEEGIRILKQYVDTLLVISNDKLRHQFGNLKMKEAFAKADNVLATAAKCITDVINSTGQINVDFADVCTVMRNGGVAILGNASVGGEGRAQRAIEEAMNSPLLNDNEISGAKWILININSAEGEHEFTMDEVDIIQNYLLSSAGEGTDVILGMGYDNTLGDQIGITLIATGFEYKDPFSKKEEKKPAPKKEEKIVLSLNTQPEPKTTLVKEAAKPAPEAKKEKPVVAEPPIKEELAPKLVDTEAIPNFTPLVLFTNEDDRKNTVDKKETEEKIEWVLSQPSKPAETPANVSNQSTQATQPSKNNSSTSAASGGYLARPTNIYAEPKTNESIPDHSVKEPVLHTNAKTSQEDESSNDMQLVFKDDIPAAEEPRAHQAHPIVIANDAPVEESQSGNEAEEQKRRAAERIQKLRNLSFNINAADPNNEFETVPAYIRRNLELYNTITNVESFYSNVEVKADENNNGQITTINTFLDGKNPD